MLSWLGSPRTFVTIVTNTHGDFHPGGNNRGLTFLSIDGAGKVPLDDGFKARENITEHAMNIVLPNMLRE